MATITAPSHRRISSIRPNLTSSASVSDNTSTSPHTPVRAISAQYGSPTALRAEDECVVLDIGSRYLRCGFAGEAAPRAVLGYGPEEQRRVGDYRRWAVGYDADWRKRPQGKQWGESHELWRPDVRGLDLGLVADKLERAIREAFTKFVGHPPGMLNGSSS